MELTARIQIEEGSYWADVPERHRGSSAFHRSPHPFMHGKIVVR